MSAASPTSCKPGFHEESGTALLAIALLATALVYLATIRFDFTYDDGPQIIANNTLTSWQYLPTFFTGQIWKFLQHATAGNYYRPVFMSWLLVNRMLFGLNPAPWHATTLAIHVLATWLSFIVARQILGNGTQAGFAAILFGVHPIHIESVAWVSGVTDPLMAVFVFTAFWAWIRGENSARPEGWRLLAVFLYLLGCFTKETAMPLPLMIVAYDVLLAKKNSVRGSAIRAWALWMSATVYLAARTFALRGLMHPDSSLLYRAALSVPVVIWEYLRRLVWPVGLAVFYDLPPVTRISEVRFWVPLAVLVVLALVVIRSAKRLPLIGFSSLWIFLFLLPAILGLPVFLIGEWLHDRYLYLPAFGLCLMLGYAIEHLPGERILFNRRAAPVLAMLALTGVMAFGTAYQEQYWANSLLLFVHAVRVAPMNPWARGALAWELFRNGDRQGAHETFDAALKIDPRNWKNLSDYGRMLYKIGDYRGADEMYGRALEVVPNDASGHFDQGVSRFFYGNYPGAEAAFRDALRCYDQLPGAHLWLGYSLEKQGDFADARREYLAELELHADTSTDAQERIGALDRK